MDWYKITSQIAGNVIGILMGMWLIDKYGVEGLIAYVGILLICIVVLVIILNIEFVMDVLNGRR